MFFAYTKRSPMRKAIKDAIYAMASCHTMLIISHLRPPSSLRMVLRAATQGTYRSTNTKNENAAAGVAKVPERAALTVEAPAWREKP